MKEFSLLMSVYGHENAQWLSACFDSVYGQSVRPSEIVLVEDGPLSEELYAAIAHEERRWPCMRRVVLEHNSGLGVALDHGLRYCSYDIVARMDTDDICLPERFEVQLDFLARHPEVDVLGAWITEFDDEPSNVVGVRSVPESHEEIFRFGKGRNPMNHPVVMFRKAAVLAAGGYLPCYLFEDYFLWGRMLMGGCRFHNLQRSLLLFRRSPEMIRRRGGLAYAVHEISFMQRLRDTGYISTWCLARNVCQRFLVRILPNGIRSFIYRCLLRTIP